MIGAAIEELYADRLTEQYEALAYHYSEGQEWEKALAYLDRAGDKAASAFANQEALDYYARAIEVAERLADGEAMATEAAIAEKRGYLNFGVGAPDAAVDDFAAVKRCGEAIADAPMQVKALTLMGVMHSWGSDPARGEECLREALELGKGSAELEALAGFWRGGTSIIYGKVDEGFRLLERYGEMIAEVGDPMTRGFWGFTQGMRRNWEGQFRASLDHLDRWRGVLDETVFNHVGRLWNESLALAGRGEYSEALKRLHQALITSDRMGEVLVRSRALNTVAWIHGELQDHETAVEWNKRSEEAALAISAPDPEIESNARLNLADSLVALGRLDEAESYYKMVEEVVRNPVALRTQFMQWSYSQHFFHSYGELWLTRGDHEKALGLADECIKLAESTNRPKNVVKGRRLKGQALLAQGRLEEAESEIEMALPIAKEIGNPPQLWKTYAALGDLRRAQGRSDEARDAYREAYSVIESVAEGLTDEALRETFLTSAHVEGIRQAAAGAEG